MRVRLTIAYDGSGFHGFALNDGVRTVAGDLVHTIERVTGEAIALTCAGRTDKGVHAMGQVVSVDLPDKIDLVALQRSVNRMLGPEIAVSAVEEAEPDFDARRSATARTYRYTVLNREVPDPFLARTAWVVPDALDLRALILSCDPVIGEHDFSCFCRKPKVPEGRPEPSMVRVVERAEWTDLGDSLLRFQITASSFCHQMVRSVVGTVVGMGLGKRAPGEMMGIIGPRYRQNAGQMAPAHGLTLWAVRY